MLLVVDECVCSSCYFKATILCMHLYKSWPWVLTEIADQVSFGQCIEEDRI